MVDDMPQEDEIPLGEVPSRNWRRRADLYRRQCEEEAFYFTRWEALRASLILPLRGGALWATLLVPVPVEREPDPGIGTDQPGGVGLGRRADVAPFRVENDQEPAALRVVDHLGQGVHSGRPK